MIVFSFDHPINRELNRALIRNVQAVVDEKLSDAALVKCELSCLIILSFMFWFILSAARTYFKTRKNCQRKILSGKQAATAAECRQRRHNVSV